MLGDKQRAEFLRDGYLVLDEFLSRTEVDSILASITTHIDAGGQILQVDRRDLIATQIFKTIAGDDCEKNIYLLSHLWRESILSLAQGLVPFDLQPLNDSDIGLNLNITERSGLLSFH